MHTLDDLHEAQAALDSVLRRWENYSGNNPRKYDADIANARATVHVIEESLKSAGVLALSEQELRDRELDHLFPDVQSREIVEWNGKKYQRRFSPVSESLSGKTVKAWKKYWEEVRDAAS